MAYAQSYFIVDNTIKWVSKQNYLEFLIEGKSFIKNYLLYGNAVFNASMAIFRKEVFEAISKEYINFKFCGDWLFWGLVATQGKVFISGKILNYFRNHTGDVSSKAYSTGLNFFEDIKVLNLFYEKNFIDTLEFKSALYKKYVDFIQKKKLLHQHVVDELQKKFEYYIYEIIHPSIFVVFKRNLISILRVCKKIIKQDFP